MHIICFMDGGGHFTPSLDFKSVPRDRQTKKVSLGIDRPELDTLHWILVLFIEAFIKVLSYSIKGDSNPNDKYVLSERAL